MRWMVYNENFNVKKIEKINILEYSGETIKKMKKKNKMYDEFCKALESEMRYHYWARCEYEVVLARKEGGGFELRPWICAREDTYSLDVTNDEDYDWEDFLKKICAGRILSDTNDGVKIDIFDQLKYRWDDFCKYCWEAK